MIGDLILVLALAGAWAGAGMATLFLRQGRRVLARRLAILAVTALILPLFSSVAVLRVTVHGHGDTGSQVEVEANRSARFHEALYDGVFLGLLGFPPLILGVLVARRSRIEGP